MIYYLSMVNGYDYKRRLSRKFVVAFFNMNVKEENICRLCLTVAENDFEIIDEITRKMFEDLLLNVNLDICKDPIICKDCTNILIKCFNFKSACIVTGELKCSFAPDTNGAILELKDLYEIEKDADTVDNNFVCRFCSNRLNKSNFFMLDSLMNDITFAETFQTLVPEMDFDVIKNSIICTYCRQDLEYYIKFVKNCCDVEEKIIKYCQNACVPYSSTQVKLSEVQRFLFQKGVEFDYIQNRTIKHEVDALVDMDKKRSGVKTEEALEIKVEEINLNKSCETPSNVSVYESNISCGFKGDTDTREPRKACAAKPTTANYAKCMQSKVSETQIFKCATCTYETKHKSSLKRHDVLIHKAITELEMHKCSICPFKTKQKGNLKTHTLVHKDVTDVEMYKCPICTLRVKRKSNLKTHMLIHKDVTEVELYKCSSCTYQTKLKGNLKIHTLIHKDVTELEMHKCSTCTYETKQKSKLKCHMLTHKNITEVDMYKCLTCTFQAKRKGNLTKHMLVHKAKTEIEMYKCSSCTYEAKQKGSLKRHMIIHKNVTEVEMHKCSMCTYKTKYKCSLKIHINNHKSKSIKI